MSTGDGSNLVRSIKTTPIEVLDYEINMLRRCFDELRQPPADVFLNNILIESYLVHFRALLEFFAHPKPRDTDLTIRRSNEWATRTLSQTEIDGLTSIASPLFTKWFNPIGQQLAHCTHPRYLEKQTWPIKEMQEDIERVLSKFVSLNEAAPYR